MGQRNAKYALPDEVRIVLTQHTPHSESELRSMHKIFCKMTDSDNGVKTHEQFFALAPSFGLFELLANLKFFDLTPVAPKLRSAPSFRAAQGSADISSEGLSGPAALANPDVRSYWSDLFFHVFDTNKDGTVDFCEFVLVLNSIQSEKQHDRAKFLFEVLDKGNTGAIGVQELFELHDLLFRGFRAGFLLTIAEQVAANPKLVNLPQDEVQALMKIVEKRIDKLQIPQKMSETAMEVGDVDRDGLLTFHEYYTFVTDTMTRRRCEKTAIERVGPLLDELIVETVDLIKQLFSKQLAASAAKPD